MYTIDQWIRDSYGLLLHTDRPAWRLMSAAGLRAAAHAAGFIAALDLTNRELIAQLTTNGQDPSDPVVQMLAAARDAAWQAITVLAADAHRLGCTSLPSGPHPDWAPVCVRTEAVGPKLYPALANDADPSAPPRFARTTAERITGDLAARPGQHLRVRLAGTVHNLARAEPTIVGPDEHTPDDDGLYTLTARGLDWRRVRR
ncbi:MAG: hypothetical protein HKP61_05350 [Dactylosporangium sp.]|nr:hypothetical protein [Dactylosporangium sp.]NNJ60373.1 hypothetical protein [Dactylosporangium sp.]